MKNNLVMGVIAALVLGGVVGFFGGMQFQKSQRPNILNGQFQRGNPQGITTGNNNSMGQRPTFGEIISKDDKSITVKEQDGSTKIIILSEKTSINKQALGTFEDLKIGEKVSAFGTSNPDGSVTALSIQLGERLGGGGMGPQTPTK